MMMMMIIACLIYFTEKHPYYDGR